MSDLRFRHGLLLTAPLLFALSAVAEARTICTLIAYPSDGRALLDQGECGARATPASTFKIALSVIAFDAGLLHGPHSPEFPYREGYVDWGGENWRQTTDPTRWMKYSVVWYSQILAHALGRRRIEDALRKFDYGDADMSGDPGQGNGLDRAWIGSSLKISPLEQTAFLGKLVERRLPASREAMEETMKIVEIREARDGWELHGKTGFAYPRRADGVQDQEHGFGWYVGWAVRDGRTLVFARLDQDDHAEAISGGLRARDEMLEAWPDLAAQALASASESTASQTGRRRHDP